MKKTIEINEHNYILEIEDDHSYSDYLEENEYPVDANFTGYDYIVNDFSVVVRKGEYKNSAQLKYWVGLDQDAVESESEYDRGWIVDVNVKQAGLGLIPFDEHPDKVKEIHDFSSDEFDPKFLKEYVGAEDYVDVMAEIRLFAETYLRNIIRPDLEEFLKEKIWDSLEDKRSSNLIIPLDAEYSD